MVDGKLSKTSKSLCQIATDLKARTEMLRKNRICFKCLRSDHTKPNCKNNIKCYKCKKEGDHHTALYNPNKVKENAQFVQKVIFKPLMDFKQNHYAKWKYYKS